MKLIRETILSIIKLKIFKYYSKNTTMKKYNKNNYKLKLIQQININKNYKTKIKSFRKKFNIQKIII